MKIVVFLLVLISVGNLFAQNSLLKDTNYFDYRSRFQKNDKNYKKDSTIIGVNVPPPIDKNSENVLEWYQLGNINSGFKYVGFKIHPKDLLISSSGKGLIPIMHYNLDETNSVVDFNIYVSQKIKKTWFKTEKKFKRQKELIELVDFDNLDYYFNCEKGEWNFNVIELPRDLDTNKFIWVFFTLKNEDEEIALYFPNEIKQDHNKYFQSNPAYFKLSIYDDRQEFDSLLKIQTDSLISILKQNYKTPQTKIRLIKDYQADNLFENYFDFQARRYKFDRLAIIEEKLREIGFVDIESITIPSEDIEKNKSKDRVNIFLKSEALPKSMYVEAPPEFLTFLDKFNNDSSFQKSHVKDEIVFYIDKGFDYKTEIDLIDTLQINKNNLNIIRLSNIKTNLFERYSRRTFFTGIKPNLFYLSLYYDYDANVRYGDESFVNLQHCFEKIGNEWFLVEIDLGLEDTDKKEQEKILKNYLRKGIYKKK